MGDESILSADKRSVHSSTCGLMDSWTHGLILVFNNIAIKDQSILHRGGL